MYPKTWVFDLSRAAVLRPSAASRPGAAGSVMVTETHPSVGRERSIPWQTSTERSGHARREFRALAFATTEFERFGVVPREAGRTGGNPQIKQRAKAKASPRPADIAAHTENAKPRIGLINSAAKKEAPAGGRGQMFPHSRRGVLAVRNKPSVGEVVPSGQEPAGSGEDWRTVRWLWRHVHGSPRP